MGLEGKKGIPVLFILSPSRVWPDYSKLETDKLFFRRIIGDRHHRICLRRYPGRRDSRHCIDIRRRQLQTGGRQHFRRHHRQQESVGLRFQQVYHPWIISDGYVPPIMLNMSLIFLWCAFGILFYYKGKTFRKWTRNDSVHNL